IIRKAYDQGIILSGVSAGAICWFEQGLTDSVPNQLRTLNCLGFLKGSNCPHFDGEPQRQPVYRQEIKSGRMKDGIACDDGVALHFVDEQLIKVISSQENKKAIRFEMKDSLTENVLIPELLFTAP
ncbi:MAG: Type 1 glutamine amidotransferase-like domain-containing protein, partial [Eudoraea sp.]|nr:Type 1 glutamine amidotransferase-like domain-containing protein [Eudoraea sp.]